MNARPQSDGLPENASGFCEYLVTQLFAYWGANSALVIRKTPSRPLEAVGAWGWLSAPEKLSSALTLAQQEFRPVLSQRHQLLFSTFEDRLKPEFIAFFDGRCKSGFWVDAQVPAHPGGLFVSFEEELDTDGIEQVRQTFPLLRASLRVFMAQTEEIDTASTPVLSPRQTRILVLMSQRLTYREIAKALFISESTVKQEAKRIFQELGVTKRLEAVRLAQKLKK
jgi:DNA-binding CsgD family transcriptional regulator